MNQKAHESIDPYYKEGDVFQRDDRYYEQAIISTRKSRTPNKSMQGSQAYKTQGFYGNQSMVSQTHETEEQRRLK